MADQDIRQLQRMAYTGDTWAGRTLLLERLRNSLPLFEVDEIIRITPEPNVGDMVEYGVITNYIESSVGHIDLTVIIRNNRYTHSYVVTFSGYRQDILNNVLYIMGRYQDNPIPLLSRSEVLQNLLLGNSPHEDYE